MSKESSQTRHRERCPQDIKFIAHYPEENPEGAMDDIVKVMAHIGLFDGIKQE
jgi:hypothetical protein